MDKRSVIAFLIIGIVSAAFWWKMSIDKKRYLEELQRYNETRQAETTEPAPDTAPDEIADGAHETTETSDTSETAAPASAIIEPRRDDIEMVGASKYEALFTNRGGCIRQVRLSEYKQTLKSDEGFLLLEGLEGDGKPLASLMLKDPQNQLPLDTQNYEIIEESTDRIAFKARFANGLVVTKEFFPQPDKYEMKVRITFKNEGAITQPVQYDILAAARVLPEGGSRIQLVGAIGALYESGRVNLTDKAPRKVRKVPIRITTTEAEPVVWAGASNRYFAAALIPTVPEGGVVQDVVKSAALQFLPQSDRISGSTGKVKAIDNLYASLRTPQRDLAQGEEWATEYTYFMGPKKKDVLAEYPLLEDILDYGMFGWISKLLLGILKFFHRGVANYGVCIVLLTMLVKVALHRLTRKGQIAMHKMQKLSPLIKEIQQKYKNDKQRASREQMQLFSRHGANPMSGCMPLLFQMPVFLGLFRMLGNTVELRHEGFLFWINDLSAPDTIASIGSFPVNILPLLMVVSWLVQQSLMPKSGDPQQAQQQKMMKFMPIMFGVICYPMASGLVLYWLTSTFLGIIEQKLIKLEIARIETHGGFPDVAEELEKLRAAPQPQRGKGKRR